MLNDLKKEITDCYMYGEIICQQGFGQNRYLHA